jgi:hypothetical protein
MQKVIQAESGVERHERARPRHAAVLPMPKLQAVVALVRAGMQALRLRRMDGSHPRTAGK